MELAGVNWQEFISALLATGTPYLVDALKWMKNEALPNWELPLRLRPLKWVLAAAIGGLISALGASATGADPNTLAAVGMVVGAGSGVGYLKARNKPPRV